MADLKTNYVDDVLDSSKNQLRKYQQIQNDDGTFSFVDVTEYTTTGTSFGAKDINDTNSKVNELNNSLINITSPIDKTTSVKFTNCTSASRWRCHVIPINDKLGLCVLKAILFTGSTTIQYTIPKSVYGVDINAVMTGLGIHNVAISLGTNGADGELYTGQRTGLQANGVYEINDTYLTSI